MAVIAFVASVFNMDYLIRSIKSVIINPHIGTVRTYVNTYSAVNLEAVVNRKCILKKSSVSLVFIVAVISGTFRSVFYSFGVQISYFNLP